MLPMTRYGDALTSQDSVREEQVRDTIGEARQHEADGSQSAAKHAHGSKPVAVR
jgi:hypothetical protein